MTNSLGVKFGISIFDMFSQVFINTTNRDIYNILECRLNIPIQPTLSTDNDCNLVI